MNIRVDLFDLLSKDLANGRELGQRLGGRNICQNRFVLLRSPKRLRALAVTNMPPKRTIPATPAKTPNKKPYARHPFILTSNLPISTALRPYCPYVTPLHPGGSPRTLCKECDFAKKETSNSYDFLRLRDCSQSQKGPDVHCRKRD